MGDFATKAPDADADSAAHVQYLKDFAASMRKAADGSGNEQVKAAVYKAADQFEKSSNLFMGDGVPTDISGIQDWANNAGAGGGELEQANRELQELCPMK